MAKRKPGLPKKYAKMGFKRGWAAYKRARGTSRTKRRSTRARKAPRRIRRAKPIKGGRKMGKSFLNTQTLMKFVRLGALAAPAIGIAMQAGLSTQRKIKQGIRAYTGFDLTSGKFDFGRAVQGWLPYLGAVLFTYGIPKIASIIRRL